MMNRGRQQGVALISVLLVFTLVTLLASEMMTRNYIDIRKTAQLLNTKQAYYYALGGEEFARQILFRDSNDPNTSRSDNLLEPWATSEGILEIEQGEMTIKIIDMSGQFNLNSLVDSTGRVILNNKNQFDRLQDTLSLNDRYTSALLDWLDADNLTASGDEESAQYPDYFPANQPLGDKTELRLLTGFNYLDFEPLSPHVTALPEEAKINLNTANKEVIKSLSATISDSEVEQIVKRQQLGGYDTVSKWISAEAASLASVSSNLSVTSDYFEVQVKVLFDQHYRVIRTQLYREPATGKLTVLKRLNAID